MSSGLPVNKFCFLNLTKFYMCLNVNCCLLLKNNFTLKQQILLSITGKTTQQSCEMEFLESLFLNK